LTYSLLQRNSARYVIKCLTHYSTIEIRKMVYHVYFNSAVVYGIIFWGNSTESSTVFFSAKENCEGNIGN